MFQPAVLVADADGLVAVEGYFYFRGVLVGELGRGFHDGQIKPEHVGAYLVPVFFVFVFAPVGTEVVLIVLIAVIERTHEAQHVCLKAVVWQVLLQQTVEQGSGGLRIDRR